METDAQRTETMNRVIVSFDIGVKNLAVCVMSVNKESNVGTVLVWKIISLAEVKEKIPSVHELAGRLFMELDALVDQITECGHGDIDTVLVENQPSRLNGSMKSIQMMIYSYFQLRRHWEGTVKHVQMISASQKLQGHDVHESKVPVTTKKGYELNKWKAVQLMNCYVEEDGALKEMLNGYKKKDDMADALLQSISWMRKHGIDVHACKST